MPIRCPCLGLARPRAATGALTLLTCLASLLLTAPGCDPDAGEQSADCPVDDFLDVSAYNHTNYDDPELSVRCDGDTVIVESNGIPNFDFVPITPSELAPQDYHFEFPLYPEEASQPTEIPLLGAVAVAINGMPIFGPNEAANLDFGDPFLDEILDFCNGHTGPGGSYHFHARPDCLFEDAEGETSLVVGYAFDGYPILAPYVCDDDGACTKTRKVESSYQRTQEVTGAWDAHEYIAGSGDLDECNGMIGPSGDYRYYATDSFPYLLGCYHGTPSSSTGADMGGMGMGPG